MAGWILPWKYVMVLDFGEDERTGYTCAQCGEQAVQYVALLTDSQLAKFYFDLQCAAEVITPPPSPAVIQQRISKLIRLKNRGSVKVDAELMEI